MPSVLRSIAWKNFKQIQLNSARFPSIVGVLTLSMMLAHVLFAQHELVWSGPGVLLLKNGNVVQAKHISPRDKFVIVQLDDTAEVQIATDQVVHVAADVLSLYRLQTVNTSTWGVGEHFNVAKWCLRNGLIDEAYGHYMIVKRESSEHSKFKQFESEMREALLRDPMMRAALGPAHPFEKPDQLAEPPSRPNDTADNAEKPSNNFSFQKATLVQQDYFRRQIQPFLALRCGQAGCHGTLGKTEFHIARSGTLQGRSAGDVSLDSAVRYLQGDQLEKTILWQKATQRHGSQPAVGLDPKVVTERELLNRLRFWFDTLRSGTQGSSNSSNSMVQATSGQLNGAVPIIVAQPAPSIASPSAENPRASQPPSADARQPTNAPPEVGDELLALEREIAKLEAKELSRKPRERHDPEEFNRRYLNPLRSP
jgi:hypothetical protein